MQMRCYRNILGIAYKDHITNEKGVQYNQTPHRPSWRPPHNSEKQETQMVQSHHKILWPHKDHSPRNSGGEEKERQTEETIDRQQRGMDRETISWDPGTGTQPQQMEETGAQLVKMVPRRLHRELRELKTEEEDYALGGYCHLLCCHCPSASTQMRWDALDFFIFLYLISNTKSFGQQYVTFPAPTYQESFLHVNIKWMLFPVKNSAEKLFFKACKCDYVQPLLQTLHWLPVHARTDYKLLTVTTSCLTHLLSLWPHCVHSFQAVLFCRHMDTLYPPY